MVNDASASDDGGFAMIVDDGQSPSLATLNQPMKNDGT